MIPFAELAHGLDEAVRKERRAFDVFETQTYQLRKSSDELTRASIERMREATAEEITATIALLEQCRDTLTALAKIEPEIRRLSIRKANRRVA